MQTLATMLSGSLGRPVLDQTGLKANYDFKMEWTQDQSARGPDAGVRNFDANLRIHPVRPYSQRSSSNSASNSIRKKDRSRSSSSTGWKKPPITEPACESHNVLPYCAVALLAAVLLTGAEHHGQVKFGGLPLPGASVTASQGEKKLGAITDLQGAYSFADLPDGSWTLRIEMLCFEPMQQEVAVKADAPLPRSGK